MDTHHNLKSDEHTGLEVLYRDRTLQGIEFFDEVVSRFNSHCDELDVTRLAVLMESDQEFLIPEEYKQLDVLDYLAKLVPDHEGRQARLAEELALFQARNLFPILRMLIYIVDQMRTHDIVWGVGRGSSVASYCLYLIGVHRIDSYAYDLPIREFLK